MMTNFKVGDKVRVNNVDAIYHGRKYWKNGDITEVVNIFCGNPCLKRTVGKELGANGDDLYVAKDEYHAIELVSPKPSKNERITQLESKVAELEAKVEALEKPKSFTVKSPTIVADRINVQDAVDRIAKSLRDAVTPKPTPNEQRKAVIERAKAFVPRQQALSGRRAEFVINKDKRTVVALVHEIGFKFAKKILTKGIAKCAPDDVFNADIGKAIALGRALGLDVSVFTNAVKPTEVVVGMRVETKDIFGKSHIDRIAIIEEFNGMDVAWFDDNRNRGADIKGYSGKGSSPVILDDTEAQY